MLLLLIVRSSSLGRLPGFFHAYPYIGERHVSSTGYIARQRSFAIPHEAAPWGRLFHHVGSFTNRQSPYTWFDRAGDYHSDALHVV